MMNRLLLLSFLCLFALGTRAGIQTTDRVAVSELTVVPGGDAAYFDVSLQGSDVVYTAFEISLQLPDGLNVDYYYGELDVALRKVSGSVFPYTEDRDGNKTYYHTLSCSYGVIGDGILKVMVYSNQNKDFIATSGVLFRVYVKASPFMKPGKAKIVSSNVFFVTKDEVQYDIQPAEFDVVSVDNQSSVTLSVSKTNKWSSCVLPFNAALPEGVKAYMFGSENGDYVVLREAQAFEAFTPYLVYSENGYSGSLSGTVDATQYVEVATDGLLNGAVKQQQVTEGYVMQNKGNGVKFYNVNGKSFTIPAGKCWLSVASGAKQSYGFTFETDGIGGVEAESVADKAVYSLDGRLVENPQSGCIYIIGGKKMIKK